MCTLFFAFASLDIFAFKYLIIVKWYISLYDFRVYLQRLLLTLWPFPHQHIFYNFWFIFPLCILMLIKHLNRCQLHGWWQQCPCVGGSWGFQIMTSKKIGMYWFGCHSPRMVNFKNHMGVHWIFGPTCVFSCILCASYWSFSIARSFQDLLYCGFTFS